MSETIDQGHLRAEAALSRRLEEVEREYRRLRRFNVILLAIVAIILGLGTALVTVSSRYGVPGTVADIVAARQFVLRASDGTVRGVWGIDKDGALRLVLQDAKARPRAKLNLLADGSSGLTFSDSAGRARAVFAFLPDESTSLVLADETGKSRVVLGITNEGSANVVFADRAGATRAGLGVDRNGSGAFTLLDRTGREAAESEPAPPADDTAGAAQPPAQPAKKR